MEYKLFWNYLCDVCDYAGMWDVDLEKAEFDIGGPIDIDQLDVFFGDKIYVISNDKWFLEPFIEFQYGHDITNLNRHNNAHLGAIKILEKYNLYQNGRSDLVLTDLCSLSEHLSRSSIGPAEGHARGTGGPAEDQSRTKAGATEGQGRGSLGPVEKEKDNKKDNSITKAVGNTKRKKFIKPTLQEVEEYAKKIDYNLDPVEFINFYEQKGWMVGKNKMVSWQAAVKLWKQRDKKKDMTTKPEHYEPGKKLLYWFESIIEAYRCDEEAAINAMGISDKDKTLLKKEIENKNKKNKEK